MLDDTNRTDQITSCICQDNCLCAIAICEQCCLASGGGVDNPLCQSGASDNLLFCADPNVRARIGPHIANATLLYLGGTDNLVHRAQISRPIRIVWSTSPSPMTPLRYSLLLSKPSSTRYLYPQELSSPRHKQVVAPLVPLVLEALPELSRRPL